MTAEQDREERRATAEDTLSQIRKGAIRASEHGPEGGGAVARGREEWEVAGKWLRVGMYI